MRRSNLSDDLITITQKLMMARERSEVMNVASDCTALIERLIALETQGSIAALQQHARSVTTIIKFTYKEIQMMSFTFKKEFIANGLAAHVIKKESGRNSYCYEIRYRSNGYNIIASSTDLAEAKRKFLAKTVPGEIEKYRVQKRKTGINLLEEVFDEWYQYKKGTITEKELKRFYVNFHALPENLRKKPIAAVRTGDIDKVIKDVKPRKYEELRTLFNGIFKYAVASGIIQHNPVALIKFVKADRQSRDALPEEEIYAFLERVELPEFEPIRQGAFFCLDWFYSEREFIRNIFYALIVGYDTQTEDIERYRLSTTPQRWEKFQSRYGHLTLTAQGAFARLFIEAEHRQRIYKTVKRKFLTRFQQEAIRQAKRKNLDIDEALFPSQEKYHKERLKRLQKYRREKN